MDAHTLALVTEYGSVALKLVSGLAIILAYVRLSSKSQLAPLSATDSVGNMALGGIVGTFVINTKSSTVLFLFVLVVWSALLIGVRKLKYRSTAFKELVDGKRIELVRNGRFIPENFKRSGLAVRDFLAQMNQRNIASFDDLKSVWYEENGQFTFIQNDDELLSIVVIEEGKVIPDQLAAIGKDEAWLTEELHRRGLHDASGVFAADYHDGGLWVYRY